MTQIIKHKQVAKDNIFKRDVNALAAVTKFTKDPRHEDKRDYPDFSAVKAILDSTTQAQTDAKNILEVNPELEMAGQILTACIVSPNDLGSASLHWSTSDIVGDSELTDKLLNYVKDFFVNTYKLEDKIEDWIYKALFTNGSFPITIIPESSLDEIINGPNHNPHKFSFEDAKTQLSDVFEERKKKYLEQVKSPGGLAASLESDIPFNKKPNVKSAAVGTVSMTCDVSKLRLGQFNHMHRRNEATSTLMTSFEADVKYDLDSDGKISKQQLASMFHARKANGANPYVKVKTSDQTSRANIGHGMAMFLPPESVAPVISPGNPENALGYLVLLDENKNPISRGRSSNYFDMMRSQATQQSETIGAVHGHLMGQNINRSDVTSRTVDMLFREFSSQVSSDALGRLRDGLYSEEVEMGDNNEFFKIMFTRTLQRNNTEILYIPAELMVYFAFNYNDEGVGLSLLEKNKMLSSLKSVIKFSNAMTNMHNAVPRRNYNVEFDETDEDPDKTAMKIMHNVATGMSNGYPFAHTNPASIINSMLMAGCNFNFTGHPEYNDTKVEVEEVRNERQVVDREYEDAVGNDLLQGLRMIPELVNSSTTVDFASELTNRNLMYNKTVKSNQKISNEHLLDFVTKYTLNSGTLTSDLLKIISQHKVQKDSKMVEEFENETKRELETKEQEGDGKRTTVMEYYLQFLERLRVALPSPEETKVSNQLQLFDAYSQAIEQAVGKILTNERLQVILGDEARDYVEPIREMVVSYLLRNYMSKNNIFPELMEVLNLEDGEKLKDIEHTYNQQSGFEKALFKLIKESQVKDRGEDSESSTGDDANSFY